MSDTPPRPGALLHHRAQTLEKGDPVALPLVQSSMFHLPGEPGDTPGYGRMSNPTWVALEAMLSELEQAPTLAYPSGMAAISAALFATLSQGKRLLIPSDGYYVTRLLASEFLAGFGVEVSERSSRAFANGGFEGFDVVLFETPSNPGLDLIDIAAVSAQVRAAGGVSIVDNTTMTALGQRPLDLGADVVVASDTKAPGGHSDLLMGHLSSRDQALMGRAEDWRRISGAIPGPHEAWLLHRGLETLEVRFERMCQTAGQIAERLAAYSSDLSSCYPGLPNHPDHMLASRQMSRNGFLISLTLPDAKTADAFIAACPLLRPATSFGGVHSSAERRARWGDAVAPGFIRLSVGCEPVEELWQAIEAALHSTL